MNSWIEAFLAWAWARHHNILSWYIRPLFIIPFCYFAYKRSWKGLLITLLLFPTSLFWFPAPAQADPQVLAYLAWEQSFVTGDNLAAQVVLVLMVIAFFFLLGLAFWKHSWLYGLVVLNAATLLKVIWSVAFAGETGLAALPPALITLAICDTIILLAARWWARRQARPHEKARA